MDPTIMHPLTMQMRMARFIKVRSIDTPCKREAGEADAAHAIWAAASRPGSG